MKKILLLISVFALGVFYLTAQTPTDQDCLGAIPVCQYTYYQSNSYSGEGNYPSEISTSGCPASCMSDGEKNDVWYVFTVQTSGNLLFNITPNNSSDDYDWAVYDLTNANCSDIYSNSSLQVSCNWSATSGVTGANGGSSLNCADASDPNDNAVIPVTAGETYVLNVSNYSSTQYGYTLDFTPSSASIFDNVPPVFQSVNQPIPCGATSITFNFSENVMCSSASTADFQLNGPGGPYTITSLSSVGCTTGASMDNTFTIGVNPPIMASGLYEICLTNNAGSVEDACGNLAAPACFSFTVQNIATSTSVVDANCGPNGSATVSASGGSGSYTYTWSTTPPQSTPTATGLAAGTYYVTVSDGSCFAVDTVNINDIGGPTIALSAVDDHCGQGIGSVTVVASGGTGGPYTYSWNTTPPASTATVNNLTAGSYSVTVDDGSACPGVGTITVNDVSGPVLSLVSTTPETYGMTNGEGVVSTTGGTAPVTIVWNTVPPTNGNTASNLSSGTYTVIATDAYGCADTLTVYIGLNSTTYLTVSTTAAHCGNSDGTATVVVNAPVGNYTVEWNTVPPQTTETITNLPPGTYTVTVTDSLGTYVMNAVVNNIPGPSASFMASPNPATIGNGAITFLDMSIGATSWYWDFGDGFTSTDQFPTHTFDAIGEYTVWLYVEDNHGCRDSTSLLVIINDIFTFYIPNAFSPNGDGRNDVFSPYGISVDLEYYSMKIYDRWGKIVFQTTQVNMPWDGNIEGRSKKEKLIDTYSYVIEIKDYTGIKHEYRGKVTLIY